MTNMPIADLVDFIAFFFLVLHLGKNPALKSQCLKISESQIEVNFDICSGEGLLPPLKVVA